MYVAVEGCCHGELDMIYQTMQNLEKRDNIKIDILLCCGDFQAVRDEADLSSMAVPDKYKSMGTFWEYYNGSKKAPYLTIFIGGNHEASNHLQELPYGGWVAPNIYYMGYGNIINYKGLRIGGLSGIFKYHDYNKGHFEKAPYDDASKRSVYHIRNSEVFKMMLLENPVDIMMSHDWPNGIVHYGDVRYLLRKKPFFEQDIQRNRLGSPPLMDLIHHMKPRYWFSGHLHVKFAATVCHDLRPPFPGQSPPRVTEFLALDKCLPRRDFLQVVKIDSPQNSDNTGLCYDPEWLSVLRATNDLLSVSRRYVNLPKIDDINIFPQYKVTSEKVENAKKLFQNDLSIPLNFKCDISPLYDPKKHNRYKPVQCRTSHQTTEFCKKLGIDDPLMILVEGEGNLSSSFNNSSIMEDDDIPSTIISATSINEDEIDLGSDDDDDDDEDVVNQKASNDSKNDSSPVKAENTVPPEQNSANNCKLSSPPLAPANEDNHENETSDLIANKSTSRLSLSLPPPVFGATSTPIRLHPESNIESGSPIFANFEDTPTKPPTKPLAKNALLCSLNSKRASDTDSDTLSENSGTSAKVAKTFKRRNASIYASQSEEEAS